MLKRCEPFRVDPLSMLMMDQQSEENELARLAREGDADALAELVDRLRPWLLGAAYDALRNHCDAQDAVASATLLACRHIGDLRSPGSVRAWMRQIVRNEVRRMLMAVACVSLPEDLQDDSSPAASLLAIDVRQALRRIPCDQARAIALFYLAGVSIDEISRRMRRPAGTVKRWLHLGRRRLAHELEDYATMETRSQAVIFSTDLDSVALDAALKGLRDAGFSKATRLPALPPLEKTGQGDSIEFHLPFELAKVQLVILDEQVGRRSAFELHAILKVAVESPQLMFGILLDSPSEDTVFAAWAARFDLCLSRNRLGLEDLARLAGQLRQQAS